MYLYDYIGNIFASFACLALKMLMFMDAKP